MPEQTKQQDRREHEQAAEAGERSKDATSASKFQGFSAGGSADMTGAPQRNNFPAGFGGQADYDKAMAKWRREKAQSRALDKMDKK